MLSLIRAVMELVIVRRKGHKERRDRKEGRRREIEVGDEEKCGYRTGKGGQRESVGGTDF